MRAATFNLQAREHRAGTLDRWLAARPGAAERAGVAQPQALGENSVTTNLSADELAAILGVSATSSAGVAVTSDTAMRVATVYSCVSLIAGAVATMPVGIYERTGQDRQPADHDYWWMLNEQADAEFTSAAAWEYLITSKLLHGDGFAKLLRPSMVSSRVIGWRPLDPLRVQPFRSSDGTVYYRHQPARGEQEVLDAADVLHIPSIGFDGLTSPSPITYAAREAVGTAIAAEGYSARMFRDGALFDFALTTSASLDKKQRDDLADSLKARLRSGGRAPLLLTGGVTPTPISMNARDAEVMAARVFSVEEICRIFGVPPHMAGHQEKTTSWGTGIEQQSMAFVRYTLQRHLTPIAQELNRKLWPTRARYFVEHITAALERGDVKSRFEAYRIALGRAGEQPFMGADEIRRRENLPPNPDLKTNSGGANAQPPAQTAG